MKDIRWKQRFDNFEAIYLKLKDSFEGIDGKIEDEFNELELEGLTKRFELTFELFWKTLKDYMEYSGIELKEKSPRKVIAEAYKMQIISNGEEFLEMIKIRNILSHQYNHGFIETLNLIKLQYLKSFDEFYRDFKKRYSE